MYPGAYALPDALHGLQLVHTPQLHKLLLWGNNMPKRKVMKLWKTTLLIVSSQTRKQKKAAVLYSHNDINSIQHIS